MDGKRRANEGIKEVEESPTRRRANVGMKRNINPRAQAFRPASPEAGDSEDTELQSSDIENKDPKKQAKKGGARGGNAKAASKSGTLTKKIRSKRKVEEDDYEDEEEEQEPPRKRTKRQESRAATAPKSGTGGAAKGRKDKGKRKATDDDSEQEEPPRKKSRKDSGAGGRPGGGRGGKSVPGGGKGKRKPLRVLWEKKVLTTAPKDVLDVYVFGANRRGELGLVLKDVRQPYWNENLSAKKAGIVQIATGSYHCVALTHDNRILTWGYNLGGALGREVPRDPNDDQGDDLEANNWEYTPMEIPEQDFPVLEVPRRPDIAREPVFTQVAAGNMFSFALTDDGYVYGWGTFKMPNGKFGFLESEALKDQNNPGTGEFIKPRPVLVPGLNNIIKIACGKNHAVALKSNGDVFTWGSNENGALGRRVGPRRPLSQYLRPTSIIKGKISNIYCGSYHNFAVQSNHIVWSWGWNSHGQTCILPNNPGDLEEVVINPQKAHVLSEVSPFRQMAGGDFTSAAILGTRQCYVWGRADEGTLGLDIDRLDPNGVFADDQGGYIALFRPNPIMPSNLVNQIALGPSHGIATTNNGMAYSWGNSMYYQIGHNSDSPIVAAPVMITNEYIRYEHFVWAGTGEEYGMLAIKHVDSPVKRSETPEIVMRDPGPSRQRGRSQSTSSSEGPPSPSPRRPPHPTLQVPVTPPPPPPPATLAPAIPPRQLQQGVEYGTSAAPIPLDETPSPESERTTTLPPLRALPPTPVPASPSHQPPSLEPQQQSVGQGTNVAPISIPSSPEDESAASSRPTRNPEVIRLRLTSGQIAEVSVNATGVEIAEQLYSAVQWTKPKQGWWWRPAGGYARDMFLDNDGGDTWAELLREGRERGEVSGLCPNEWLDSP